MLSKLTDNGFAPLETLNFGGNFDFLCACVHACVCVCVCLAKTARLPSYTGRRCETSLIHTSHSDLAAHHHQKTSHQQGGTLI